MLEVTDTDEAGKSMISAARDSKIKKEIFNTFCPSPPVPDRTGNTGGDQWPGSALCWGRQKW